MVYIHVSLQKTGRWSAIKNDIIYLNFITSLVQHTVERGGGQEEGVERVKKGIGVGMRE